MRQVKKKKGNDKVAATIVLCFCLIALTSIFTIKASIDKVTESAENLPVTQEAETIPVPQEERDAEEEDEKDKNESDETAPKQQRDASQDIPASSAVNQNTSIVDSRDSSETAEKYLLPMNMGNASLVKEYSMDMVIYNQTLDQYMTHPGIDIEAPSRSGVNAVADGTVTDIYEDDAYGITIEITHDGKVISRYSNLETDDLVEVGDTVKKGQQISTIGRSALYESMDKCHLHFEMYQNGKLCNPADFIDFPAQ